MTDIPAILQTWFDHLASQGGKVGKGLPYATEQAEKAAAAFSERGAAYVLYEPGNYTCYGLALLDLITTGGPFDRWGGDLLVSLPENAGGTSAVFALGGLLTPDYVLERLGLRGPADAIHLAVFLTLFGEAVLNDRGGSG